MLRRLKVIEGLAAASLLAGCARGVTDDFESFDAAIREDDNASTAPQDAGSNSPPLDPDAGKNNGAGDAGDAAASTMKPPVVPAGRDGYYAARRVYQQTQSIKGSALGVALKGNLLNTHTIYSFVTIGKDGSFTEKVCGADIQSQDNDGQSGIFESGIVINPAIFDNLEPAKHQIMITDSGWTIPPLFMPIGWRANAPSEAIPTDKADQRVFDQDGDGKPGITVKLSGNIFASGELYAVQSVRYRAEGVFDGENFTGQDFDTGEQQVLDGTIIDTQQMVAAAGNSATNRMNLVKRSDMSLTCKQLMADPAAVFPPHPVLK